MSDTPQVDKFLQHHKYFMENSLDEKQVAMIGAGFSDLTALSKKLERENGELKKDALRYRWLRNQHWDSSNVCVVCDPRETVRLGSDCPSLRRLDALIDEELGKEGVIREM